jgi:hypothetical protein
VADAIFDLAAPAADAGVLLIGFDDGARRQLAAALAEVEGRVAAAPRLTLDDLRDAAVVVFAPGSEPAPLPARAMAVLAARRTLVTGRCRPDFGLLPEVDHFPSVSSGEALHTAVAALRHRDAFGAARVWGRRAAERHRASSVYGALLTDLQLEGALSGPRAPPRSAGPPG